MRTSEVNALNTPRAGSGAVAQPAGGMVIGGALVARMAQPPSFDPAVCRRGKRWLVLGTHPASRFRRLKRAGAEEAAGYLWEMRRPKARLSNTGRYLQKTTCGG